MLQGIMVVLGLVLVGIFLWALQREHGPDTDR